MNRIFFAALGLSFLLNMDLFANTPQAVSLGRLIEETRTEMTVRVLNQLEGKLGLPPRPTQEAGAAGAAPQTPDHPLAQPLRDNLQHLLARQSSPGNA